MLSDIDRSKIKAAYNNGTLKIQSVSPTGEVEWKPVVAVMRAEVPEEDIWEGTTAYGPIVLTSRHRIFLTPTEKAAMPEIDAGSPMLSVSDSGEATTVTLLDKRKVGCRQFMYDLTVEDWHNFVLQRSRVVVSNSPDRYYHFRPPEYEGNLNQYNRVFGQIWEDAELYQYLLRALDWWNMFPPRTAELNTLSKLYLQKPEWRTAIYWGAITHACFALSANWVADEFDYSIGGVSLSLERSSKYESLKQNSEGQFDKASEAKARTVKYMRGLQQPKYGIGIRSSFGPFVGKGVLSPRGFL